MEAYAPGEQPQDGEFVKLNTNESPYPPFDDVLEAIRREVDGRLRLYPDPLCTRVRRQAARVFNVDPDMVIVGNGSDDILTITVRSFVGDGGKVVYLNPSYGLYGVLADIQNAKKCPIEYTDDYRLPPEIRQPDAKLTFICTPNNPTGTVTPPEEVAKVAERSHGIVAVDEAYADFAEQSCVDLVHRCDNILVLRSLSKSYSLAGLRIGLGIGNANLIAGMMKVKDSYNVQRLGIAGAEAALANVDKMKANAEKVKENRRYLAGQLEKLGFDVLPSQANFIFARPPMWHGHLARETDSRPGRPTRLRAGALYEELKTRRILVRYWNLPRLSDGIRISIGTRQELDAFLAATKEIFAGYNRK